MKTIVNVGCLLKIECFKKNCNSWNLIQILYSVYVIVLLLL